MIYFYSGTPGSGKSLHVAMDIYTKLRFKKGNVIATFPVNLDVVSQNGKKAIGNFTYIDIMDISVEFLVNYAREHHKEQKEGQTLVVMDECQIRFNPREFNRSDRLKWITFFTQHRKLGFNFILISQFDRLVDRQIRCLFEYDIKHRKINNFGMGMFIPVSTFIAVTYWYGVRERVSCEFFTYKKKYGRMYDTFTYFDGSINGIENVIQNEDPSPAAEGELNHSSNESISENASCDVGGDGGRGVPAPTAVTGWQRMKYISFSKILKFFKRSFSS